VSSDGSEPFDGVVLWDFDGTLAFREGMWRGCLIDALTEVDPEHNIRSDDVRPGLVNGFPWHRPEIGHEHLSTPETWWADLEPMFHRAYTSAGVPDATAAAAAPLVRAHYTRTDRWTVYPDTRPALDALSLLGWRHVVISNHVPELPALIAALGLDDLVEIVVTSAETGWEKPNPKMFAVALHRAGHPELVWMVGDSIAADIAGASAAGIPSILVRTPVSPDASPLGLDDVVAQLSIQ
jgi:putative hydrolase of the HAD superfamily